MREEKRTLIFLALAVGAILASLIFGGGVIVYALYESVGHK